jgi:hypothetical protein
MKRSLFNRIYEKLAAKNEYFQQRPDGIRRLGFHGKHKCVVAMRMLAYGTIADSLDDGYAMAESTVLECVKEFASTVIAEFEDDYLRPPNQAELNRILAENEARCNARVFTLSKLQHKPLARKYFFVKLGSFLNPYRPNS